MEKKELIKLVEEFISQFGDCEEYIIIGIKNEEWPYKVSSSKGASEIKNHLKLLLNSNYRDVA